MGAVRVSSKSALLPKANWDLESEREGGRRFHTGREDGVVVIGCGRWCRVVRITALAGWLSFQVSRGNGRATTTMEANWQSTYDMNDCW
jgi:hypothetical protein